ncbi:hypothetical protein LCGC14_0991990, partial [marine sediment metagenome]
MTTLVRIAVAALVAFILSSCNFDMNLGDFTSGKQGNGKVVKESRDISEDFTEVSISEGLMVYLVQADEFKIDVEADENVIDLIATDIKNGKLRIHAKENIGQATKNIYVSLPEIEVLQSSSGAHLEVKNVINSDKLEVDGSSGAQLEIELIANTLDLDASSGANLTISGKANRAQVDVSSGGNINATKLNAKICDAEASSGGNLKIQVSDALTADASSGG